MVAIVNSSGKMVVEYIYDAWGRVLKIDGELKSSLGIHNPLRYRGYVYDQETGLYYLQSRYYNPNTGRFINADNQLSTGDFSGLNLFAYCGNNPVNRTDPTGEAWWHWVIAAAVVAIAAGVTVVTCGMSVAAAATAVGLVANGVAASTTAATVAAGAFIGSATALGGAAIVAAAASTSVQDFYDQGSWGTVASTVFGAGMGGFDGYSMYASQPRPFLPDEYYSSKKAPKQSTPYSSYTNYKYNDHTHKFERSTAYYDVGGRQVIRIDWTNHGYSDHGNPHVHYTTFNARFRDGTTVRWD